MATDTTRRTAEQAEAGRRCDPPHGGQAQMDADERTPDDEVSPTEFGLRMANANLRQENAELRDARRTAEQAVWRLHAKIREQDALIVAGPSTGPEPGIDAMNMAKKLLRHAMRLDEVLEAIVDDATGDLNDPDKRIWPIRWANYRAAKALLDADSADERG